MKLTNQKIAMAELCGIKTSAWRKKRYPCGGGHECSRCGEFTMSIELWPICKKPNAELPDFVKDIDSCRKTALSMEPIKRRAVDSWLTKIAIRERRHLCELEAFHWCEAVLRASEKWEEYK